MGRLFFRCALPVRIDSADPVKVQACKKAGHLARSLIAGKSGRLFTGWLPDMPPVRAGINMILKNAVCRSFLL